MTENPVTFGKTFTKRKKKGIKKNSLKGNFSRQRLVETVQEVGSTVVLRDEVRSC